MNGADYIATVRLSTKANVTVALPGETCERVPAESLPWLAEQGLIKTPAQLEAERLARTVLVRETTQDGDEYRTFEPAGEGRFEREGEE